MINRCSRWWVNSCHPLILLVVANSFHCVSSCEMSLPSNCHTLLPLGLAVSPAHTLTPLKIQERKWTVTHVWLVKVAAGFRDNTSTGLVWSNGQDFFIQTYSPHPHPHFEYLKEVIQTEDESLSDNVTDAALFFRMNFRMMHPERIRESGVKTQQLSWRHREQALQFQPFLLIFLLTPLQP